MGIGITERVPLLDKIPNEEKQGFMKSLDYMGFKDGEKLEGHQVDMCSLEHVQMDV